MADTAAVDILQIGRGLVDVGRLCAVATRKPVGVGQSYAQEHQRAPPAIRKTRGLAASRRNALGQPRGRQHDVLIGRFPPIQTLRRRDKRGERKLPPIRLDDIHSARKRMARQNVPEIGAAVMRQKPCAMAVLKAAATFLPLPMRIRMYPEAERGDGARSEHRAGPRGIRIPYKTAHRHCRAGILITNWFLPITRTPMAFFQTANYNRRAGWVAIRAQQRSLGDKSIVPKIFARIFAWPGKSAGTENTW